VVRCLLVLLALAVAPSVALGQGGTSDEDRARAHFETGAVLYADENYEGALAAFEESYRLREVPVVLFNIAQTLRRLNRYGEAIESYERYLREERDLPADRRTAVRSTISELRRALAPITVDTDIEGATIEVDGRVVGTTPLGAPLELAAGVRTIVARRDGYVPVREELRVVGGRPQELSLRLPQAETAGTLTVESNVEGALVRIDGVEVGVAPASRRLGQGGHSVEVEADGYDVFRQEVVLAARQQRVLFAELEVGREVYEEWWFWTAVGAVVIGAAVVGVVVASSSGQADPVPGSLGTVAALR
jgi:hypothetical protein